MPVPVALEEFARIVFALQLEEFLELRERRLYLAPERVAVVRRVIAATMAQADVDQRAERIGGADEAGARALDVEVEDHARIGLLRPGEEALAVLLDPPHGAVDDLGLGAKRVRAHLGHERLERLALAVDLGDHLGAATGRAP